MHFFLSRLKTTGSTNSFIFFLFLPIPVLVIIVTFFHEAFARFAERDGRARKKEIPHFLVRNIGRIDKEESHAKDGIYPFPVQSRDPYRSVAISGNAFAKMTYVVSPFLFFFSLEGKRNETKRKSCQRRVYVGRSFLGLSRGTALLSGQEIPLRTGSFAK